MFRIDRNLVNLAASKKVYENIGGETDGAAGYGSPNAPLSAEMQEAAEELVKKAEAEAAEILVNAQNEAKALLRLAQDELEEERNRAWQIGYNEGIEEARTAYDDKILEDDEVLRSVLSELHEERVSMYEGLEDEVVSLSLGIAKKIITLASENDDAVYESVIKNALRQMDFEGKITIRVGPAEYDRFFSSGNAVFSLGDGVAVTASVIKDTLLDDGDLIVDSDNGAVNAGINSQLRRITLAFSNVDEN